MANPENEGRTEPATPKKRQKARDKGQVAKSREINTAAVLLTGVGGLTLFGTYIYHQITLMMQHWFTQVGQYHLDPLRVQEIFYLAGRNFIFTLAPLLFSICVAAVLANYFQVGWLFSWEKITPKLPNINPLAGLTRLFSPQSLLELGKSAIKMVIIGAIVYFTVKNDIASLPLLMDQEPAQILTFMVKASAKIFWRTGLALIIVAVLDFIYQKFQYEKNLKMAKFEVKDEHRQAEGDPQVKSKIRSLMFQQAYSRMMSNIPKADVVITNPTHYAVALKYDSASMEAPQVVAKGKGYVALKIRELAEAAGVPLVENKILAQALFRSTEVGDSIPSMLYRAVAEILAHIYRTQGRRAGVA
jgi:flagellar biosynthetic protein FlhB